jgi:ribosomal protein S11
LSKSITSTDIQGAMTARTSTGFTTTAGSSQIYAIQVNVEELASLGYPCVRLKCVEVVDSPVLGGIAIALAGPRFGGSATATEIA